METRLNQYLPDASCPDHYDPKPYRLIGDKDIRDILSPRKTFSHKGTYGHALILAGAAETMGAAILSAKGCLYAGAGLTTVSIPESGLIALNTALPEVMYVPREEALHQTEKYTVIGIGPGLGTTDESLKLLKELFKLKKAVVVDADALNLLSEHQVLLKQLPEGSVLTPHMKEFDRLFGDHDSWFERLQTGRKQAVKYKCTIVLKNQYTFIIDEQGTVWINSTGNPAMAQGGMGDVLTGMVTAYCAQKLTPSHAAVAACYFHGRSGDDLAKNYFNVTASQVAENVPKVVKELIK
jgi:hydroxyethylthiazole kinase-like uncharacterized protein yjeF